jgi:hypothetical protein
MLSALFYMGGSLFSLPNWTARGKDMLYQGIFSLIIMASFPAIYLIFSSLFTSLFLGDIVIPADVSMYDVSENLLLWNYVYYFIHLVVVTFVNMFVLTFFGKSYSVPMANRIVPFDLTVLQSPLMFIINVIVGILSTSIMINGFQLLFLNFVRTSLLPFLLPIGLLLRAFPTSMHAGNVLVGVCLAAFIIVPIVYAIDLQILPAIIESPQNIQEKEGFQAYNSFALMSNFYNREVLTNVVVESANCKLIKQSKELMGVGLGTDGLKELQKAGNDPSCGISFWNTFDSFFSEMDGWVRTSGNVLIGAASLGKGINVIIGSVNALAGTEIQMNIYLRVINRVVLAFASLYIIIFFYEILLGVAVSFIILSVILPFIKFTIIILFIREFTYTILGTQVSLGQITRLL